MKRRPLGSVSLPWSPFHFIYFSIFNCFVLVNEIYGQNGASKPKAHKNNGSKLAVAGQRWGRILIFRYTPI